MVFCAATHAFVTHPSLNTPTGTQHCTYATIAQSSERGGFDARRDIVQAQVSKHKRRAHEQGNRVGEVLAGNVRSCAVDLSHAHIA